jgi:uncharacterized membrane protein
MSAARARRPVPVGQYAMLLGALVILALAGGALAITLAAGRPLPWQFHMRAVSPHVAAAFAVLALGAAQLALKKGDRRHRLMGYAWCALMAFMALSGIAIQLNPKGGMTMIHLASSGFSVATLVLLPVVIWAARTGRRKLHRNTVLVLFFLMLQAGALTFISHRTMGLLIRSAAESVKSR